MSLELKGQECCISNTYVVNVVNVDHFLVVVMFETRRLKQCFYVYVFKKHLLCKPLKFK